MRQFRLVRVRVSVRERNLLYEVIKAFAKIDLSLERVDHHPMGYVFEELIRIGAEQSNEGSGRAFYSA